MKKSVVPAKAGIHRAVKRIDRWTPAFAGATLLFLLLLAMPALAQEKRPVPCGPEISSAPLLQKASFQLAQIPPSAKHVTITFVGHASFLIETPCGIAALTDYNGHLTGGRTPDIVTMNRAHSGHFTDAPDPAIRHVLRGWDPAGGIARHDVSLGDLRVFNVPMDLSERHGRTGNSNSAFVFHVANLCIVHMGHMQRSLTADHFADIGRIDVMLLPIDGMSSVPHEEALKVIEGIKPAIVIPMHIIFRNAADRFAELAGRIHPVRIHGSRTITVSRDMLPGRTEIVFLQED